MLLLHWLYPVCSTESHQRFFCRWELSVTHPCPPPGFIYEQKSFHKRWITAALHCLLFPVCLTSRLGQIKDIFEIETQCNPSNDIHACLKISTRGGSLHCCSRTGCCFLSAAEWRPSNTFLRWELINVHLGVAATNKNLSTKGTNSIRQELLLHCLLSGGQAMRTAAR